MGRPDITGALTRLRSAAPLVHNITNYVVMNTTANALLAIGASPAMVHAHEQVEDFAPLARALVATIGTLSPPWAAPLQDPKSVVSRQIVSLRVDPGGRRLIKTNTNKQPPQ